MLVIAALLLPSVTRTDWEELATLSCCGEYISDAGFATRVVLQVTVELTVAVLLVSSGSRNRLVPLKSAFAVLPTDEPQIAAGSSVPVIVYVTEVFAGSVTSAVLMLPVPEASQVAPPLPVQVQAAPVMDAGTLSTTVGES